MVLNFKIIPNENFESATEFETKTPVQNAINKLTQDFWWDPRPKTWDLSHWWVPEPETRDPDSETRDPRHGT